MQASGHHGNGSWPVGRGAQPAPSSPMSTFERLTLSGRAHAMIRSAPTEP